MPRTFADRIENLAYALVLLGMTAGFLVGIFAAHMVDLWGPR